MLRALHVKSDGGAGDDPVELGGASTSVIAQTDSDGSDNDDLIEAPLFSSRRSVMIVPYIQKAGLRQG